jgi:large subunit ribosomal protein L2
MNINYNFRLLDPGFVSTLKLVPLSSKLLALVSFPSGELSYFPTTDSTAVFNLLSLRGYSKTLFVKRKTVHYTFIYLAKAFRKVSNLELRPGQGVQYARSAGCSAVVTKFDVKHHAAMVKLPSGVSKLFSFYGLLLLDPSSLKLKRKTSCTRSGYWRAHGLKPKVRGVARNPVDHPHGGRTKSIKYPRTP